MSAPAPLMLSISGARGIVGESMTADVAAAFARAFLSVVRESAGPTPVMVVGRDTRASGEPLAAAVVSGLAAAGARVVDIGVAATPTVAVTVTALGADGGMVVTASHNPSEWNGLKCITGRGGAPPQDVAQRIVERFLAKTHPPPPSSGSITHDTTADACHVEAVTAAIDTAVVGRACPKVVLDSNHGAGGPSGRALLERLGCEVVTLGAEPDGRFERGLEPICEHLAKLNGAVTAEHAAVGFAQDPDADRLAIVDETGRCLGEEYTLVLAARGILETHGAAPVVVNLSTSRMIEDLAARFPGATVHRTPVGEANVALAMHELGAPIGGEGNGGVILPPVCLTRDSLSAMALVLQLLATHDRPLSTLVDDMPSYCMIKDSFRLAGDDPGEVLQRVAGHFAASAPDTRDGVRITFEDAWVHLRPSNTEPIVRVIAEAHSRERALELIREVMGVAGMTQS